MALSTKIVNSLEAFTREESHYPILGVQRMSPYEERFTKRRHGLKSVSFVIDCFFGLTSLGSGNSDGESHYPVPT